MTLDKTKYLGCNSLALERRRSAGPSARFSPGAADNATTVALFDQGLTQVLQAAVSGLVPKTTYVLALADSPEGKPPLEALATFSTNPAGAAVVGAVGPIRQVVAPDTPVPRRYLVIAPIKDGEPGAPVQLQRP